MLGPPKTKPPGLLRRSDVAVTARMRRIDPEDDVPRALALAKDPVVAHWVSEELRHSDTELAVVTSVAEVIATLFDSPPPRPQLLIADFDPLSGAEVFALHELRARGWFGAIIGLGSVGSDLRTSLTVVRVLARPLDEGALERAVAALGLCNQTRPVAILPSPRPR